MTSRNDITGDFIKTNVNSDAFKEGWERIFGKEKPNYRQITAEVVAEVKSEDPKKQDE